MPTIAAIDGPALGGGLELALACDLRVCRKGVALGLTESRLGGLAGNGSVRLTRLVGPARAKEMLFTGETIAAEQALAWGLVNRVVDEGTRAGRRARARRRRSPRAGPLSNRLAKKLVDAAQDLPLDAALSMSTVASSRSSTAPTCTRASPRSSRSATPRVQRTMTSAARDSQIRCARRTRALLGDAAVLVWNDVAGEGREQFYDWHDKEHIPERSQSRAFGAAGGSRGPAIRPNG